MTLFTTKQLPPVTVLIPVYNLEDYVSDAITCAVCQDYSGELRIIVLDDGSTDQTLVQAKQAASRYSNILVYSQPNRGRRIFNDGNRKLAGWRRYGTALLD